MDSLGGAGIGVPSANDVVGMSRAGRWNMYAVAVMVVAVGAEIVLFETFLGAIFVVPYISKKYDIPCCFSSECL